MKPKILVSIGIGASHALVERLLGSMNLSDEELARIEIIEEERKEEKQVLEVFKLDIEKQASIYQKQMEDWNLKETAWERRNQGAPFYAKFVEKKRKKK